MEHVWEPKVFFSHDKHIIVSSLHGSNVSRKIFNKSRHSEELNKLLVGLSIEISFLMKRLKLKG